MVKIFLFLLSIAWAQDADIERAKMLYSNGKMLFEEGKYQNAVDSWQLSWEISQNPLLLYNIALAYEEMKEYQSAIDYLYKYRSYAEADQQQFLKEKIDELEVTKKQQEEKVAELEQQAVEQAKLAAEQLKVEAKTKEEPKEDVQPVADSAAESSPVVTATKTQNVSIPVVASWGTTGALFITSSTFGILTIQTRSKMNTSCPVDVEGQRICPKSYTTLQEDKQKEGTRSIVTGIGTGLTLASAGLSTWLTMKNKPQSNNNAVSMWIAKDMVGFEGKF